MATKKKTKVNETALPNAFNLEFETHNGVKYPTIVVWRKTPTLDDWRRFAKEHPEVKVSMDKALDREDGRVFGAASFSRVAPVRTSIDVKLRLDERESNLLDEKAASVGLAPATYARQLVRKGLGLESTL